MKVIIQIECLEGRWDVEIPNEHEYVKLAEKRRDESGKVGWDAVHEFEGAICDLIKEDLSVGICAMNSPDYKAAFELVCDRLMECPNEDVEWWCHQYAKGTTSKERCRQCWLDHAEGKHADLPRKNRL